MKTGGILCNKKLWGEKEEVILHHILEKLIQETL